MSQNLGNLNFYLRSSLNYRDIEDQKTDLNKENDFYSLINKKRKRHISNKNYKIMKCPSCASTSLRNFYKHIHEKKSHKMREFEENNQQMKELKYQLENKVISSPKKYLFPPKNVNIINKNESNDNKDIFKNNITISKIKNDIGEKNKQIGNVKKKANTKKISMVCETKRDNKEIGKGNSRKIKKDDDDDGEDERFVYQNDDLNEDEKIKNDKQNIIECKLVKVSAKKKKVVKPKKSKKIIIQVERVIAPQI